MVLDPTIKTALLVLIGLICVFIIIKIAKVLIKLIALLVLVGLIYFGYKNWDTIESKASDFIENPSSVVDIPTFDQVKTFFGGLTIRDLKKECEDEGSDNWRCDCIYEPIMKNLKERLSNKELKQLLKDEDVLSKELKVSYDQLKSGFKDCVFNRKGKI